MIQIINKKFLVDAMLGNIAKKLRLLGFDTKYSSTMNNSDILSSLKNEDRILITKDFELSNKALAQNLIVVYLKQHTEFEQFLEIKKQLELENFFIDVNYTRCTICNGVLEKTQKSNVSNKVPNRVLEFTDDFWQCNKCNKIYWKGTHIINLQNFVKKVNERK